MNWSRVAKERLASKDVAPGEPTRASWRADSGPGSSGTQTTATSHAANLGGASKSSKNSKKASVATSSSDRRTTPGALRAVQGRRGQQEAAHVKGTRNGRVTNGVRKARKKQTLSKSARAEIVQESRLEKVRDLVRAKPGSNVRQLVLASRSQGIDLDKSEMNAALYKLKALGVLDCTPGPTAAPIWSIARAKQASDRADTTREQALSRVKGRITGERVSAFQQLVMSGGETISVGFASESSNDPYILIERLDQRVVVTLNTSHPIYTSLIHTEESLNLLVALSVADALTQTRINRLSQPDEADWIQVRDAALREFALAAEKDPLTLPPVALSESGP